MSEILDVVLRAKEAGVQWLDLALITTEDVAELKESGYELSVNHLPSWYGSEKVCVVVDLRDKN